MALEQQIPIPTPAVEAPPARLQPLPPELLAQVSGGTSPQPAPDGNNPIYIWW
jgi:hypothetical protein